MRAFPSLNSLIRPVLTILLLLAPGLAAAAGEVETNVEPPPPPPDLTEANRLVLDGEYAEAEALLGQLMDGRPDDPALLLMRGELLMALGRADDALPFLRRCSTVDPHRPRLQFQLGGALAATGDRAAAIEAFGREIENNDDGQVRTLAHLNRSLLFQQDGRWIDAANDLEAVLLIQPERVEVYGDLATILLEAGKPRKAWEALQRGESAGYRSADHYYSVGARLYREKLYEPAVEAFTAAIETDPDRAAAERSLAATLERLGRDDEAREHLRRYLEMRPDAPDAAELSDLLGRAGRN